MVIRNQNKTAIYNWVQVELIFTVEIAKALDKEPEGIIRIGINGNSTEIARYSTKAKADDVLDTLFLYIARGETSYDMPSDEDVFI